ncbi:MAG: lactate racemase domain-containing protein [Synergistaceae bacterium]|nr:lactate racemase domain-containing protein [Synergistaceae bacterium]
MAKLPPMKETFEKLLGHIELPQIIRVRQKFDDSILQNEKEYLTTLLRSKGLNIKAGNRIAITCGSRGINKYTELLHAICDFVRSLGAEPILIPSMGSHGGATSEGQKELLAHYGVTEESMGAKILSSMETICLGTTEAGVPVYIDKNATECDGIILFNRVKAHTSFAGTIESGLCKMTAIGLGKQKGAETIHSFGIENMSRNIKDAFILASKKLNFICGIATVENSYGKLREVHVWKKDEILLEEEKLLRHAYTLLPHFYTTGADILCMQQMGKNISGTGLDCKAIGKYVFQIDLGGPRFKSLCVLDLCDDSDGSAYGMGMAQFATRRFYEKIDFAKGYINSITAKSIYSNQMPVIMDTDKLALQATANCLRLPGQETSMVFALDTEHLEDIYMTAGALANVPEESKKFVETIGNFFQIPFDNDGNLTLFKG